MTGFFMYNSLISLILIATFTATSHACPTCPSWIDARIVYTLGLCPNHTGFVCTDQTLPTQPDCGEGYVLGCSDNRVVGIDISGTAAIPEAWGGVLPTELAELSALERLSLRWNTLEGTLPSESVQYSNYNRISLDGNRLSGEIPSQLIRRAPEILQLPDNNFQGRVPAFPTLDGHILLCSLVGNPELVCPFDGPSACSVYCSVDCDSNNITLTNCSDPVCLAGGTEVCYDPCVGCPKCVLDSTTSTYECVWPPTPTPIAIVGSSQLTTSYESGATQPSVTHAASTVTRPSATPTTSTRDSLDTQTSETEEEENSTTRRTLWVGLILML